VHGWSRAYPAGTAPFGLAGWQAAYLAVGVPGLLLALWVLTLREPTRGIADGLAVPAYTPGAWRSFGRELASILPPFTLYSAARVPGALRINLCLLAVIGSATLLLTALTGDKAQWIGFGVGLYAVASWMQMLRARDRPTFALLFGTRAVGLALLGFGGIGFIVYSFTFWVAPYVMRTFAVAPHVAGLALGVPTGFAAAVGCVLGGYLSDLWKRRDPRGRLLVCALGVILTAPLSVVMLTAKQIAVVYVVYPLLSLCIYMYLGSGAAAIQDCVLPRMRGVAGATYLLALSLLGMALGPYLTGKIASLSGSLRTGLLVPLVMVAPTALLLWLSAGGVAVAEASRAERARAAGEAPA
ncbi:MAG TPA: MFS transporter, partial [Steroidobacteraceae bacterium]|nr:MFS transporter [Steroidobacteraceae bacterium]